MIVHIFEYRTSLLLIQFDTAFLLSFVFLSFNLLLIFIYAIYKTETGCDVRLQ